MANVGAFRISRILLDGRNRFTKVVKISQTQKRNTRKRLKIVQENAAIIREGKEALDRVNARIISEHHAAAQQSAATSAVEQKQKN